MTQCTVPKLCVYCGRQLSGVRKGEHIIPDAIGGARTIKTVCRDCNNQLSVLDTELCSRSPLSVVASQEIGSYVWQLWDVDHAARNLLLEARPNWESKSLTQYPQIVFDPTGPQIRGDYLEMLHFGQDDFVRVFVRGMLQAFRRHEAGEKRWLHFERVETNPAMLRGYRFPPRIVWRRSIGHLAARVVRRKRTPFVLRYLTKVDRRFALNVIDNWSPGGGFQRFEVGIGSHLPALRCYYDPAMALRALLKIAINVLVDFCPNTSANKDTFPGVFRAIIGNTPVTPRLIDACGFVWASDIQPIRDEGGGHSFRLLHTAGQWEVFMSFFGGRIGAVVRFPGPNRESWVCANITAPLRSANWTCTTHRIFQPLTVRVEWEDPGKIMPTVEIHNLETWLHVTHG